MASEEEYQCFGRQSQIPDINPIKQHSKMEWLKYVMMVDSCAHTTTLVALKYGKR